MKVKYLAIALSTCIDYYNCIWRWF